VRQSGTGDAAQLSWSLDSRTAGFDESPAPIGEDEDGIMARLVTLRDPLAMPDLRGIDLYPDAPAESWIEFDSMINVRPGQGNRSRGVEDPRTWERIADLVGRLVHR